MKDDMIFSICPDREFFGREREIDYICCRATEIHKRLPGIFLAGKRWTGKTEVLRRIHQRLFWNQARTVPIYYQFNGCRDTEDFAEDYIREIIKQYVAFIKRDTQIIKVEISLDKLERLLIDTDISDIAEFITRHREAKKSGDYATALRNAITAPHFLSLRSGIPLFLILDDIDHAGKTAFHREWLGIMMRKFTDLLRHETFSLLMASSTKNILEGEAFGGSVEVVGFEGLEEGSSVSMMIELCRQYNNVEFDTEILTLAARKLEGNPMYIKSIVWEAYKAGRSLVNLRDFVEIYANVLIEGNLGFSLCSAIPLESLNDLRVLNAYTCSDKGNSVEEIAERLRCSYEEVKRAVEAFISFGLVEKNLGSIQWTGDNVIKDFIDYRYETRIKGRSPEEVKTLIIRKELKEGFYLKGTKVDGKIKEEIMEVLKAFNGQEVLTALLHNQTFTVRYKNGVYRSVDDEKEKDAVILPQIVGCFDTSGWGRNEKGPPIIIAHGFQNNRYDTANEVIWIVGIKESMTPVNADDAEDFIRRSSLLKENFRIASAVKWFVGKEGFTIEAQKRLGGEGVYSTDAVQLCILRNSIEDKEVADQLSSADTVIPNKEFDVVLPMVTKSELVAARAVEEIGTEMGFDEDSVSQIKTALIEACINAFEHSKVKGSRIYLRFVVGSDRLVIHVQNKGVGFDRMPAQSAVLDAVSGLPHKRGWGMELMKGLMDEVRLETLRSGTKIVMVKYLIRKGENGDDRKTQKR